MPFRVDIPLANGLLQPMRFGDVTSYVFFMEYHDALEEKQTEIFDDRLEIEETFAKMGEWLAIAREMVENFQGSHNVVFNHWRLLWNVCETTLGEPTTVFELVVPGGVPIVIGRAEEEEPTVFLVDTDGTVYITHNDNNNNDNNTNE